MSCGLGRGYSLPEMTRLGGSTENESIPNFALSSLSQICCCSSLVAIKQARSPADSVHKGEPLGAQDREEKGSKRT